MPGLVACRRRWDIGSDDLVFPAFGELLVRIIWLIAVAVVYDTHRQGFNCDHGNLLHVYCIGMLAVLVSHIILAVAMAYVSMQGTIVEMGPRRKLPSVLYVKLFLFLPELAITILGTYWAFALGEACDSTVIYAMRATSLAGWAIMLAVIVGLTVAFDPLGGRRSPRAGLMEEEEGSTAAKRIWELRCQVLCCCAAQDEHSTNAFRDIAQTITDFFKGLDVVPTDIAAGLILAQAEQQRLEKRMSLDPLSHSSNNRARVMSSGSSDIQSLQSDPVFPNPCEWMTIPNASHYMKFASACYGWALFMYSDLCSGLCKLSTKCTCCACTRLPNYVMDDNCCGCNTAAIIRTTGIKEEDIIYASFYNRVYQIPFFVALDHKKKAVVIAIRGTLSLRDALTDLTVDSEVLETEDVSSGGLAHKGILQAAKFIKTTLDKLQLLQTAYERAPGYTLVVTGHSLGAGAASILSILLKPQYPDLHCWAFSPPGWLVSLPLSRYTEAFTCSVVVGKDIIPRLGFLTMEQLKTQILKVIRSTHIPKYKILMGGVWYLVTGKSSLDKEISASRDSVRTSLINGDQPSRRYTEDFNHSLDEAIASCSLATSRQEAPLYMPGQVLYLEETHRSRRCCGSATYVPAWARAESFDEILISPRMIQDHIPDVVTQALGQLTVDQPRHVARVCNSTAGVV